MTGGLGVLNLELHNKALLIKQLHKFYMRENVPWVKLVWSLYGNRVPHAQTRRGSFWWRDIFSLVEDYRSITKCSLGNGNSILFWKDFWMQGELLCDKFPRLFSYVLNEDMSVAEMSLVRDLRSCFSLPLLVEAYAEFHSSYGGYLAASAFAHNSALLCSIIKQILKSDLMNQENL
jgi:hypothetical protein